MKDRFAAISETGIPFVGKITASLSHEMRNVLATIYENAGLLEDLVALAERGRPLDPNRIRDQAAKVKGQVRRGRDIVDRLSLLAHSSDEPIAPVDVGKTLELVISLGERIASMRGVALRVVKAGDPVLIRTDPFVLENLIWLCIECGLAAELPEKTVTMTVESSGERARIRFKGVCTIQDRIKEGSIFQTLSACAERAGADLAYDETACEIVLSMPLDEGHL
jgi:hypothetical protein